MGSMVGRGSKFLACGSAGWPLVLLFMGILIVVNLSAQFYIRESRNGGYSKWSHWGNCSRECGEGIRVRTRSCDNPSPGYFGSDCSHLGPNFKKSDCFVKICPINGRFGPWGEFGKCDKACGGGVQIKVRACNNPPAAFGGKACEGVDKETRSCNTQTCPPPIDGGFSNWSAFGNCSVTCGKGKRFRSRTCTNPPPQNGGKPCQGSAQEVLVGECEMAPCKQPTQSTQQPTQQPTQSANATTAP